MKGMYTSEFFLHYSGLYIVHFDHSPLLFRFLRSKGGGAFSFSPLNFNFISAISDEVEVEVHIGKLKSKCVYDIIWASGCFIGICPVFSYGQ